METPLVLRKYAVPRLSTGGTRRLVQALIILGTWSLVTGSFVAREFASQHWTGKPVSEGTIVSWLAVTTMWACTTPGIAVLARKFPFIRGKWRTSGAVYVAAGVLISALISLVHAAVDRLLDGAWFLGTWQKTMEGYVATELPGHMLFYSIILAVILAINYYKLHVKGQAKISEFTLRAMALESQLANAQLEALRMQLHPHFLFNTLHSITVLIRKGEQEAADHMVTGLSDLLRFVLNGTCKPEQSLREELEFISRYLAIQQIRFGERLQAKMEISHDTLGLLVPTFLLQPLVENAVTHGIARSAGGGIVEIRARIIADLLELEVRDNGPGISAAKSLDGPGVGLRNTRQRLQQIHDGASRFELMNRPLGGACVRITIPLRRETVEGANLC
jgi:two-component system LytT family sensor kinase